MIELGGGKAVEAGYANKCTSQLVEDVITDDTAALLYVKSHHSVQKSILSIEEMVEVSKKHNIPLIIDAAAEQDLIKYVKIGADIVIFSGAKALEGTSSGIVVGTKEYIEWVRLQSSGIGRAMKIGKENILGLATAIEYYLNNGPESGDHMLTRLKPFIDKLNTVNFLNAQITEDLAGREIYRAQATIDEKASISAKEVAEKLVSGSPAIYIRDHQLNNGIIEFDIRSLNEKEMSQIIDKLKDILNI